MFYVGIIYLCNDDTNALMLMTEEAFKRSHQLASGGDYCQVSFSYDQPSTSDSTSVTANEPLNDQQLDNVSSSDNNDQQPFQIPVNFEIPKDIKMVK